MEKDDLHYEKVLDALLGHVEHDDELVRALEELRQQWARFNPKSRQTLGYAMQVGCGTGPLGAPVADTTLADAWLYCDFGHGDTNVASRVGDHGIDDRYQAAVLLVSNVAVCEVSTLNLVHRAWSAGAVSLDKSSFTEEVLARNQISKKITAMASGPAGTPTEELLQMLDQASSLEIPDDQTEV
ncbi:hypothetical protein [Helcobacillus massiliensis]|uniref:Uncharacterized protein n=1 Tax=Helcobacillus massiliensis TaxID=521392 RepID=A0A839QVP5_9MICO|nr:hypothetical protein [Helcobacillus massiliensis]MBB3022850.1 hypothetical protein [Helcobacillus massiliensis]